ncbi:MAG: hypothetical protein ACFCUQ_00015 [Kiloniellales bacterium]
MFKVLLLICAVTVQHKDCQEKTALTVLQGPEATNEVMCGLQSQAYLASSALAVTLGEDEYLKITCRRTAIGKQNIG